MLWRECLGVFEAEMEAVTLGCFIVFIQTHVIHRSISNVICGTRGRISSKKKIVNR